MRRWDRLAAPGATPMTANKISRLWHLTCARRMTNKDDLLHFRRKFADGFVKTIQ